MASAPPLVSLPQLHGSNFNNWQFRVLSILEERQLRYIVEKERDSDEELTQTQKDKLNLDNIKAKSIIIQCLTDKHLDIVKDEETAKGMMRKLENTFQRKSIFNKLSLKKKLLTMKLQRGEKLDDHFLKFDTVMRELENSGSKTEESDKICHLLLTLSEEYEPVITAIETLNTEVTMDFVKSRLLDEELKLKSKNVNVDVLYQYKHEEEASFKAMHPTFSCFRCGGPHKIADCRQKPMQSFNTRSSFRRNRYSRRNRGGRFQYNRDERANNADESEENESGINFLIMNCSTELKLNENTFIIDSGATQHMVTKNFERYMKKVEDLPSCIQIKAANGQVMKAKKAGIVKGYCQGRNISYRALIVEGLKHNLISIAELVKKNIKVIFSKNSIQLWGNNFNIKCKNNGNLFVLDIKPGQEPNEENNQCNFVQEEADVWHKRLGHLNRKGLRVLGLPTSNKVCEKCIEGKATRLPFPSRNRKNSRTIGELIHSDVAGPINPQTKEGYKYFQVIIDDFSNFLMVKLLKTKDEAAGNLIEYIKLLKTQFNVRTKRIRCDNGGEFSSHAFKNFCKNKGIIIEYTMPYSPQQNGKSERMNRTLQDKVRIKLAETKLPKTLWGEAVLCSAYEINRSPTRANNMTPPAKIWYGVNDVSKLRIFGSKAWASVVPKRSKFEPRAWPAVFVGYGLQGYRVWNFLKNTVTCVKDVRVDESSIKFNSWEESKQEQENSKINPANETRYLLQEQEDVQIIPQTVEIQEELQVIEPEIGDIKSDDEDPEIKETPSVEKLSRVGRKVKAPSYLEEFQTYMTYCLLVEQEPVPESFEEAKQSADWKIAIQKELNAHKSIETWTEKNPPENEKLIETRWVFRIKEDGTKKARLVARGFQVDEKNYCEPVYAPVARLMTIRTFLAVAMQYGWTIRQLDIPTAFLNGKLEANVYIQPPKGLETRARALKLNRALYGLKEAPKVWNDTFDKFVIENQFKRSDYDSCFYHKKGVWLILYVDDILVTGNTNKVEETINALSKKFQAKDMGQVREFLGMTIKGSEENLFISQSKMVERILKQFNMEQCKGAVTPMEEGFQLDEDQEIIQNVPYRQLIGSLLYLSTTSRPDITYSVAYLSRVLDKPTLQAWKAAKRILRYLQETKRVGLLYKRSSEEEWKLKAYADANWGTDKNDRKSVSGSVILLGENPICWTSKKQTSVALSTAEAEYIAAATSAQDLINLKGITSEFYVNVNAFLICDNKSAILMSKSRENLKKSKHIDIKYHFIKDLVQSKKAVMLYVCSEENLADLFTKPLGKKKFTKLKSYLCESD